MGGVLHLPRGGVVHPLPPSPVQPGGGGAHSDKDCSQTGKDLYCEGSYWGERESVCVCGFNFLLASCLFSFIHSLIRSTKH